MGNQLLSYSAPYVEGIFELLQSINAQSLEFEKLWENIKVTHDNFYVKTADLATVEKYENMLGIVPFDEDSLDDRRARILLRLNNQEKLSSEYIYNIANTFEWGDIGIELIGKSLILTAKEKYGVLPKSALAMEELLEKLPAHLVLSLVYKLWRYGEITSEARTHGFLGELTHEEIKNRYIGDVK